MDGKIRGGDNKLEILANEIQGWATNSGTIGGSVVDTLQNFSGSYDQNGAKRRMRNSVGVKAGGETENRVEYTKNSLLSTVSG